MRKIGVEDAGEVLALATTEQLVAAFDEDLFSNDRPGEREVFDRERFVIWLEVLLEAGDEAAASRFTELSEDVVLRASSSIVLVVDHDALLTSMSQGGDEAVYADKALESCLTEELDGYLLISRGGNGWDAALALILALDRNHRDFLVRILDRCADMASDYVDDLDALTTLLSAEDSLAEDVEADREERRNRLGYVEPRAARSFLSLARSGVTPERDPVTRAYFRDLRHPTVVVNAQSDSFVPRIRGLLGTSKNSANSANSAPSSSALATGRLPADSELPLIEALRSLNETDPATFGERMEEIAYLTNVLIAGATAGTSRLRSSEAAEAVLATVAFGAELTAKELSSSKKRSNVRSSHAELGRVLKTHCADLLFRKASSTLDAGSGPDRVTGFLKSRAELEQAARGIRAPKSGKG